MALRWLVAGGEVACAPGTAEILLTATQGLGLELVDTTGQPLTTAYARALDATRVEVSRVDRTVVLRVKALRSATMPPGSRAGVSVGIRQPSGAVDQVLSPETDVSGLPYRDLVRIAVDPRGQWVLTALDDEALDDEPRQDGARHDGARHDEVLHDPSDTGSGGLPGLALAAARSLVGASQAPLDARRGTVVVLDRSVSMQLPYEDGVVQAVVDVVVGINPVFGERSPVALHAADRRLGPPAARAGAAAVDAAYAGAASGFRLLPVVRQLADRARARVLVVTDGVPADAVEAATELARHGGSDSAWTLVLLARSTADALGHPVRSAEQDELAGVDLRALEPLRVVTVRPEAQAWAGERLTQPVLESLVRTLVADRPDPVRAAR